MTVTETHNHSDEAVTRQRGNGIVAFLRDLAIILVVAFIISFVVKTFFVRSFYIPSGSMNQTLQVDDRILVNQTTPNTGIDRGDVIVFKDPGGWLYPQAQPQPNPFEWVLQEIGVLPATGDDFLIKRVIGVGGDHVVCCTPSGQMTVNGVPLDEPYVYLPEGETAASATPFDVAVPEGMYWVMGDNRNGSKDSRYNTEQPGEGFIPHQNVVGTAFVINWPISRWAWLGNYPDTFAGVEDAREQ
jgi:signal peptidase I